MFLDPDQALANIIRWVQKRAGDDPHDPQAKRRALLLVKRLQRIREEVGEF